MSKKLKSFKKNCQKPRGLILGITAVVAAITLLVVATVYSGLVNKMKETADYGYATYYAARTCLSQVDALDPSNMSTDIGCTAGKAVNFVDSTQLSTVCDYIGEPNTVLSLGDHCSCTTQILQANANSYDISAVGVCNSATSDRTVDGGYTVTINKAISNCESCAQFCKAGKLNFGDSCVTSCGKTCNSCCNGGPSTPFCNGTCQN